MRLPLELIAAILLAGMMAGHASGSLRGLPAALAGMAVLAAGCWLSAHLAWAWTRRALRLRPADRERLLLRHARLLSAERVLTVAGYALFLRATGWADIVRGGLHADVALVGADLLVLGPYLLALVAGWLAHYPATREFSPADWTRGEYLRFQARGILFLLGPWLALELAAESARYWPAWAVKAFERSPLVQWAASAAAFGLVALLFPLYLVRLWPSERLAAGPLRDALEALLAGARIRCRELVVWKTGRSRMPNAAVMGFVPRLRYVVFTDALLENLAPGEIEAVLAHEAGHVKHHHIGFYAAFSAAFLLLLSVITDLLPAETPGPLTAAVMLATFVLYWRYAFGWLSRKFERQADVAACELTGSPLALISALEKLAVLSGGTRSLPSWRHHSIAERVEFLGRFGFDREALRRYHQGVRAIKWALAAAALALLAANAASQAILAWS